MIPVGHKNSETAEDGHSIPLKAMVFFIVTYFVLFVKLYALPVLNSNTICSIFKASYYLLVRKLISFDQKKKKNWQLKKIGFGGYQDLYYFK